MFKILFIKERDNYPPLGIMQLSAIAKEEGVETSASTIEKANLNGVDLVAYGLTTGEHKKYVEFNRKIDVPSLVGGPHATFFPEVQEEGKFDYLIQGEAEVPFRDFIRKLKRGIRPEKRIMGEPVKDLDSLPFPDRTLFEGGQSFMIGRGCPYSCTYCFNHVQREMFPGTKLRRHSVDYAIEELKQIKKYNPTAIKIFDDVLTLKVDDWFRNMFERYRREIGIPFWALNRYDLITEEFVSILSSAGCRALQLSIEAVDDEVRNKMLKRNMSIDQILSGQKICNDHGIKVIANVMIGLPHFDLKKDFDAVRFCVENKLDYVDFPIYQPYPRTKLGDFCIKQGYFDGNYNRIGSSYNDRSVLSGWTDKEKDILSKLSMLGTVAVLRPEMIDSLEKLCESNIDARKLYEDAKRIFYKKNLYY